MTVRWTVRAAEPTAAFSPQRKCKTVWFKSPSATKKNGIPCGRRSFFDYGGSRARRVSVDGTRDYATGAAP